MAPSHVLGLSCFYHDSAATLLRDGEIVAAAQEERFTRKKHDANFPSRAVEYCLREAGVSVESLAAVAFYDKPLLKFERILETYLAYAPAGLRSYLMAVPKWLHEKLWMEDLIRKNLPGYEGKIIFAQHHESHAASAFFPSPFESAAVLTMDGVGEWATSSLGAGKGNSVRLLHELRFPHSLGLLYSAFTYYTGFKVNSGEYKVMGLAPYGEPKYAPLIYEHLLDLKEDGSFRLNMEYFDYAAGLTMTNGNFHRLFGGPPREPETNLSQREMDLAASVQAVTEEIMLRMARHARKLTGEKNLCLAGGVSLNCVGNGKILRENIFDNIWIQPAAGDAGGALGAAYVAWHHYLDKPRAKPGPRDKMRGAYLGPAFPDDDIGKFLAERGYPHKRCEGKDLTDVVSGILAEEKVVGWLHGRMEFGPRALGARSIIGDARSSKMQSVMNLKIKYRESFRPFAPTVLRERVSDYFEMDVESPYMLLVADVRKERRREMSEEQNNFWGIEKLNVARSDIPAVTHIDYSARVQTIHRDDHPAYYDLIKRFEERTGCAVIVNTSFNVRGEPIVCTPEDAYRCFMRTEMDYLVLGSFVLDKREQPPYRESENWRADYQLD